MMTGGNKLTFVYWDKLSLTPEIKIEVSVQYGTSDLAIKEAWEKLEQRGIVRAYVSEMPDWTLKTRGE